MEAIDVGGSIPTVKEGSVLLLWSRINAFRKDFLTRHNEPAFRVTNGWRLHCPQD
jgi:hypothetical protein